MSSAPYFCACSSTKAYGSSRGNTVQAARLRALKSWGRTSLAGCAGRSNSPSTARQLEKGNGGELVGPRELGRAGATRHARNSVPYLDRISAREGLEPVEATEAGAMRFPQETSQSPGERALLVPARGSREHSAKGLFFRLFFCPNKKMNSPGKGEILTLQDGTAKTARRRALKRWGCTSSVPRAGRSNSPYTPYELSRGCFASPGDLLLFQGEQK